LIDLCAICDDFDGFRWILMGFDGFLMDFDRFKWILMDFLGFENDQGSSG